MSEQEKKQQKARVLVAVNIGGKDYKPNDVITVDAAVLAAHAGALDATAAAVKYAEDAAAKAKRAAAQEED